MSEKTDLRAGDLVTVDQNTEVGQWAGPEVFRIFEIQIIGGWPAISLAIPCEDRSQEDPEIFGLKVSELILHK